MTGTRAALSQFSAAQGHVQPIKIVTMSTSDTPHIDIRVQPRYLPEQSSPLSESYSFSYTVTVINKGPQPAQLISRHWIIVDEDGHREEVKGLGVVGHQPMLKMGEAFEYTSGSHLRTPTGSMEGSYRFVLEDGTAFDVAIPRFTLDATGRVLH
jgi:ApaG protein